MSDASTTDWSWRDAGTLYAQATWSDGFFGVNEQGHVCVRPLEHDPGLELDVMEVVEAAKGEGVTLPMLIRFQDVIRSRVRRLNRQFGKAIEDAGYGAAYRSIYPIKVNQLQEVVTEVLEAGREFNIGLECGSRAELVAALPLVGDEQLLLCNGVKDRMMLEMMLNAQRLGQQVLPIIEKYTEYEQLMELADGKISAPALGVRVKVATRGSGHWNESGGSRSKFGLTIPELLRLVRSLQHDGRQNCLQLLHFHPGSQVNDIQVLRSAIREITQCYADLVQRGVGLRFLDVGGGLGVNYGAEQGNAASSINYGLREYANVVVYTVKEICEQRGVPEPVLLSESGRALTAHHSMLVVPVLGVHRPDSSPAEEVRLSDPPEEMPSLITRMSAVCDDARVAEKPGMLLECFHDAQELREEAEQTLRLGYLSLDHLAHVDNLYWSACREVLRKLSRAGLETPPAEQRILEEQLTDLYLCDFSVFHSIIDHWAIGQVFPVMPLHRLGEEPQRRARIVDLTCDSDGKIKTYVSDRHTSSWLPLHDYHPEQPYYLGIFLVGAYQEILGDAHNLMGRVDEVHVYARSDEPGNFWIEEVLQGARIRELLSQVQYFPGDLDRRMSAFVRRRIDAGRIPAAEGTRILNHYTRALEGSTYV